MTPVDVDATPATGVFIALGSNLGDRAATLEAALRELDEHPAIHVVRRSSFHETQPVGGPSGQGPYLNAVAELVTQLGPRALLAVLHEIENRHGRVRGELNGPRTLDLDLLLYHDQRIDEANLSVPHPRMWEREFVLLPLAELADLCVLRERFGGSKPVEDATR